VKVYKKEMKGKNEMRLNLGSGEFPLDGYENLDKSNGKEVYPLVAYADNSVDEIRASHILEHFPQAQVMEVLSHWISKLKQGGILKLAVPDFGRICQGYVKGENLNYGGYIVGGQSNEDDFHKSIFDRSCLIRVFETLGLGDVKDWVSEVKDCASYPISLNLQGTKLGIPSLVKNIGYIDKAYIPALTEFSKRAKTYYSQNGEDGILEAIFEKIGIENKWCLEVGAADGILFSNTRHFVEQGWNALLIERDDEQFDRLVNNILPYKKKVFVSKENVGNEKGLDSLLAEFNVPKDIDLVCIDVDGQDWHIWNQMLEYKPRVIVCEYDPKRKDDDFIPIIGGEGQAGMRTTGWLASGKNYHNLIVTEYNIIAIRDDVALKLLPVVPKKDIKIAAVMSMPRVAFTDNMFSSMSALLPLGISLERGSGVFWGQILTRLMESHLNDGTEFIITLDYDTYFTKNQVVRLLQMMQEHPEADAIIPMQMKRECDYPLIGKLNEEQKPIISLPVTAFQCDLMPMTTGHFGLTIFRVSALNKMKKPWFLPHPDPVGGWDEGRMDEDIHFWHTFADSGLQSFLAPKIRLPHLQMMATIPGRLEEAFKPQHYYITDLIKNGLPEWCEPKVEFLK